MIIEQLSSLTVKVSLTASELYEHNVDFDSLENDDKNTRSLVSDVINQINIKLGLNFFNEHLYIEAFSGRESGCILYISVVNNSLYDEDELVDFMDSDFSQDFELSDNSDNKDVSVNVIMFETTVPRSLILLAVFLDKFYHSYTSQSSLYFCDNIYRLLVTTQSTYSNEILNSGFQSGINCISSDLQSCRTIEYCQCIFDENAIEKLTGKMSF
ncbi:MAG: adaptor protein MecA [Oscillospiraceae bacterium]|nr:adaptor protein MecA [Oscillospiraceae bacterium]